MATLLSDRCSAKHKVMWGEVGHRNEAHNRYVRVTISQPIQCVQMFLCE